MGQDETDKRVRARAEPQKAHFCNLSKQQFMEATHQSHLSLSYNPGCGVHILDPEPSLLYQISILHMKGRKPEPSSKAPPRLLGCLVDPS